MCAKNIYHAQNYEHQNEGWTPLHVVLLIIDSDNNTREHTLFFSRQRPFCCVLFIKNESTFPNGFRLICYFPYLCSWTILFSPCSFLGKHIYKTWIYACTHPHWSLLLQWGLRLHATAKFWKVSTQSTPKYLAGTYSVACSWNAILLEGQCQQADIHKVTLTYRHYVLLQSGILIVWSVECRRASEEA